MKSGNRKKVLKPAGAVAWACPCQGDGGDTNCSSGAAPSSPSSKKRDAADIAASPERPGVQLEPMGHLVPFVPPAGPSSGEPSSSAPESTGEDELFQNIRQMQPAKKKHTKGEFHPDAHKTMNALTSLFGIMRSPSKGRPSVRARGDESEHGIEMTDGSGEKSVPAHTRRHSRAPSGDNSSIQTDELASISKRLASSSEMANHVPRAVEKVYTLEHSGRRMTTAEFELEKATTRGTRHFWSTDHIFPGQDPRKALDKFERSSLLRSTQWCCLHVLDCGSGDCLRQLQTSDIASLRQVAAARSSKNTVGGQVTLHAIVQSDLIPCYDRTNDKWMKINVAIDDYFSVQLCPAAYGLAMGMVGSTFYENVVRPIKENRASQVGSSSAVPVVRNKLDEADTLSMAYSMLAGYVRSLRMRYECQPAPGASRFSDCHTIQTVKTKDTWKNKWAICTAHFNGHPPGSLDMLKRVWKVRYDFKCPYHVNLCITCCHTHYVRSGLMITT